MTINRGNNHFKTFYQIVVTQATALRQWNLRVWSCSSSFLRGLCCLVRPPPPIEKRRSWFVISQRGNAFFLFLLLWSLRLSCSPSQIRKHGNLLKGAVDGASFMSTGPFLSQRSCLSQTRNTRRNMRTQCTAMWSKRRESCAQSLSALRGLFGWKSQRYYVNAMKTCERGTAKYCSK